MISRSRGSSLRRARNSSSGIWIEPGMNPAARSSAPRTSSSEGRAGSSEATSCHCAERHVAGEHVLRGHAGEVDRVFGGSEGRGVGEFQFGQVVHGHAGLERGGQHVDAFVHAVAADGLRAEQSAGVGREEDFQRDGFGAGVIAGVGAG